MPRGVPTFPSRNLLALLSSMPQSPHRNELMGPVVQALQELAGSASVEEITTRVISILKIPDEVASQPYITKRGNSDPRTKLEYDLAWTRTYLKQLGVLDNSARGVWVLTGTPYTPQLAAKAGVLPTKIEPDWREIVSEHLVSSLSPAAFERLIQRVLRETGFVQVEVTGKSGDGGIDGRGIAKINGILSFHVVFQCKRYRGSVGAPEIRDFRGAMQGRADKGLFITTGYFSREAIKEANRDGAAAIDLVDGEKLAEKLKELGLGINIELVEKVTLNEEWFASL